MEANARTILQREASHRTKETELPMKIRTSLFFGLGLGGILLCGGEKPAAAIEHFGYTHFEFGPGGPLLVVFDAFGTVANPGGGTPLACSTHPELSACYHVINFATPTFNGCAYEPWCDSPKATSFSQPNPAYGNQWCEMTDTAGQTIVSAGYESGDQHMLNLLCKCAALGTCPSTPSMGCHVEDPNMPTAIDQQVFANHCGP